MGIIRNLRDGAKDKAKNKAKKMTKKAVKTVALKAIAFITPVIPYVLLTIFGTIFALAIIDYVVELFTSVNNPELVYKSFEVEDMAEVVEIKEDGSGGYYLDFADNFDQKVEDVIEKMRKSGEYHELTSNKELLKKMIKAEVYTQFPDLGGIIPEGSTNGFQGAIQIRRVTPNKQPGTMVNTGRGETSSLEQGEVNEPTPVGNRNDRNRLESWSSGQRLKIIPVDTPIYEDAYGAGYWQPILQEGSQGNEIKLRRGDIVTYQGEYEIHENATTGDQTIYVKIKTDDDIEGYLKLSSVEAVMDNETSALNNINKNVRLANVSSRAETSREEEIIGNEGDTYVVAIAAGRNNDSDTGVVSEDGTLVEEELTIQVAERVEELLGDYSNIEVVQTGSTSRNPDGVEPEDRAELTRDANPDLCIQIYFGDGDETGVETIYKAGDMISQQLAEILANNLASSMGLTNLQAGEDIAKCVDSEGNAASLNIIENAGVTGFPSVVALGGNLNQNPDAQVISNDGVEKYAQAIVNSIDEYFKADHSGRTSTEVGEITYTDSVESRVINMRYVSQETLKEYVDSGDWENAIKSYTLDDDRNVVVATWSVNENGNLEIKTNNAMNLKTSLEKYMMPFEYLMYFYIDTEYDDFVNDLADEVMNSEIVIAVQDSITTTKTIETTEQKTDATVDRFDVDWHDVSSEETITESVTTSVDLTYVSTWCVKAYQENSYSEAVLALGDQEETIVEVPGKVTVTGPTYSLSEETVVDSGIGTYEVQVRNEDGELETEERTYEYTVYERIRTQTDTISNIYEKGEYKTEGRENVFVDLYTEHHMVAKIRDEYLFEIIENNERTANLLDLTKYLIYLATDVPWGVLDFDFSIFSLEQFTDTGSSMGGLDTFIEYLHSWEGCTGLSEDGTKYIVGDDGAGHPTVGYGIDIYNSGFLDRFLAAGYDVSIGSYIDVEFVDALEKEEVQSALQTVEERTSGLGLTQYQKYALVSRIYNCGSSGAFTTRNGKNFVEAYNSYWNQETDDEYRVAANDSMYNHPLYQNYMAMPNTSNGNYMAGLENRRKSEWILFKTGYYDRIDKWCSNSAGGTIVEKAIECHAYLRENGYTYAQAGINIPITSSVRTVDCSSYVSWVLYEAGFTEFEGYQKTSSTFTSNPWGWQEVSVSEAQPGDIITYSGHVEIVAGDAGDRFRVYNCGGDESISSPGTEELPESSVSGYTKGSILKVIRPPQS